MLRETNVANNAGKVKFNGTVTPWPIQSQKQHNTTRLEPKITIIKQERPLFHFNESSNKC